MDSHLLNIVVENNLLKYTWIHFNVWQLIINGFYQGYYWGLI